MESNKFFEYFDSLLLKAEKETPYPDLKEALEFYRWLKTQKWDQPSKPMFTDSGLQILEYLQEHEDSKLTAKDIADGMGVSSRKINGAMRKLATDGFVDKFGSNPVGYLLSSKGKEINIDDYKGDNE